MLPFEFTEVVQVWYTYFVKWVVIVLGLHYLTVSILILRLSYLAFVLFRESPEIYFYVSRYKKWIPINQSLNQSIRRLC